MWPFDSTQRRLKTLEREWPECTDHPAYFEAIFASIDDEVKWPDKVLDQLEQVISLLPADTQNAFWCRLYQSDVPPKVALFCAHSIAQLGNIQSALNMVGNILRSPSKSTTESFNNHTQWSLWKTWAKQVSSQKRLHWKISILHWKMHTVTTMETAEDLYEDYSQLLEDNAGNTESLLAIHQFGDLIVAKQKAGTLPRAFTKRGKSRIPTYPPQ